MNDFRQQDYERERRQQELAQHVNDADYRYWWDPNQGFWAWMKRQEDYSQQRAMDAARDSYESWYRQQIMAEETAQRSAAESYAQRDRHDERARADVAHPEAGSRHDDLMRLHETSAEAYHGRFSENEALTTLWERAAEGKESYAEPFKASREDFWHLVNNDDSAEAEAVRRIIEAGGFELQDGSRAPMLRMENFELEREQDTFRREQALRLSIDHITPQSEPDKGEERKLQAENLRFMLLDDNAFRGNRWDEHDQPNYEPQPDLTLKQEQYRERVAQLLREQAFRREDVERENRQEEERTRANDVDYQYWWHPNQGFWAWVRRQEEHNMRKQAENLQYQYESWLRQQDLAKEMGLPTASGAVDRHDHLLGLDENER